MRHDIMKQGVILESGTGPRIGSKLAFDTEAYVERIDP